MELIAGDFETFYSKDYTLKKLSTQGYIMDPRFECMGVALKIGKGPSRFITPDKVDETLASIDWSDVAFLAHNVKFDGSILAWRYGIRPKFYLCTMSMANAVVTPFTGSASLAKVSEHLGVGKKGTFLANVMGRRWDELSADEKLQHAAYCINDNELCFSIYKKLGETYPLSELMIIDRVIRMYLEPRLELDGGTLAAHLAMVRQAKADLLAKVDASVKELRSNPKFAAVLQSLGVDPPQKISPTTGKMTYAFAKTDEEFRNLLMHDNPDVQAIVAARMGVKSTLEESRTERFCDIAKTFGSLAVPLRYSAAHTHRLGGDEKLNLQNLTRGSNLRRSIVAPKGYKIVAVDSAQIEARINAWCAGETAMVEAFRAGRDVYAEFASHVYDHPVTKQSHPDKRFVGKTSVLGLGYGMGKDKFFLVCKATGIVLRELEAHEIVLVYRQTYEKIVLQWSTGNEAIRYMEAGQATAFMRVCETRKGRMEIAGGLPIRYPNLEYNREADNTGWFYTGGRGCKHIYGAKLVENATQSMARNIVMKQMLILSSTSPCVLQVHDELIFVVGDSEAEQFKDYAVEVMSTPPTWAPDLPLAAEGATGDNYLECK